MGDEFAYRLRAAILRINVRAKVKHGLFSVTAAREL
jgi:hypothetical protein